MTKTAIAIAALLLTAGSLTEATYRPDVREARQWARSRMPARQFRCLDVLWDRESHWRVRARGPMTRHGRARGIPQALPGRKMRSAERPRRGPAWDDWRRDALVQVAWGLRYVRARYRSACAALRHQTRRGWY